NAPAPSTAQAAPPTVIEVMPDSLLLGVAGRGTVTVVLRNQSGHALRNLSLSWLSNEGFIAEAGGLHLPRLAPSAAHSWTLAISRPTGTPLTGALYIRADFEWQ